MRGLWGLLLGACAVPGLAEAGPWAQAPGGAYVRGIASSEQLDGEDGWRADLYGEYGLADKWTLTGKLESVRYDGGTADADAYRLSVRHQFWNSVDGWAAGIEAGAVRGNALAGIYGCNGWGGELRLSAGRSGVWREKDYYFFADAVWLTQEGGCDRQRIELGYGTDLGGNFFTTQQVWLEHGKQSADSLKTEAQLGYHFPLADVALGYREELGGEFDEQAILLAVTLRR